MKKILTALIATLLLLTSLALAAPSNAPQISGDKFAEITGFPGNLPEGWTFSKDNETKYNIYPIVKKDIFISFHLMDQSSDYHSLTIEQARQNYLSDRVGILPSNLNFVEFEDQYGQIKVASVLTFLYTDKNAPYKPVVSDNFISFKGKLYFFQFVHHSNKQELQIARQSVLQSVLNPLNQ